MINKEENYLVVWASNDTNKYWYKVFNDLISNWYKAIPINPKEKEILKQKVYNSLLDFKWTIDNIIFVTQPKVTETIIQNIIKEKLKVKNIWMQPWSDNEKSVNLCNENNLHCTSNSCIMIERKK